MTLYKVIETIKMLALKHPNINSACEGNIYDIMNANPQQKYATVIITQQSHTQDDTYDHYGFSIFYVDRLVDDMDSNRVQIQSTGKSMLANIIKSFCDEFDGECENINFQTFTERFADECAGVYCTITIDMVKDMTCTEKYWDESWTAPVVSVKNQNKSVVFTENGTYVIDYDAANYTGLGKVSVEVDVADLNGSYDEGYEDGKTDGIEEGRKEGIKEQKDKLESITIKDNGTYDKEDGYNKVVVEVPVPEIMPSLDIELKAGDAGTYRPYGYDAVAEINYSVLPNYDIDQTFTENGTYEFDVPSGFSGFGHATLKVDVPDLNGSYDEGFDKGYAEGVEEGTSNAGEIIAQTAQVLNITKNGVYATKYTTPEDLGITDITGYFDDGTPFYGYAQLDGKAFMTDVIIQSDSKVEIWWRPDYNWTKQFYGDGLFSVLDSNKDFCVALRELSTGTRLEARINSTTKSYDTGIDDMWYHIMFSEEGLFINNYNVTGSFNGAWISGKNLYLNICDRYNQLGSVNGYFGMIKVDGNIIIPTEDGFLNKTTGNMMDVYQEGGYKFTGIPEVEGNLIRTVNVAIQPTINMQETGLKLAYASFTEVPSWFDWEGITDMSRMFSDCKKLAKLPDIDTSNVTTMSYMLYGATSITDIPKYDTSKVTDFSYLMYLVPIETFPELDTSSAKNMSTMFYSCSKLTYIPALYGGNLTNITTLFGYSAQNQITYFGGFKELKTKWDDNYGLKLLPNLTYESCISILENLYDFTGNGETPLSTQAKLKVHQNFLNLVGDDLVIGTNKGWQITA